MRNRWARMRDAAVPLSLSFPALSLPPSLSPSRALSLSLALSTCACLAWTERASACVRACVHVRTSARRATCMQLTWGPRHLLSLRDGFACTRPPTNTNSKRRTGTTCALFSRQRSGGNSRPAGPGAHGGAPVRTRSSRMKGVGGGADFRNHAAWARPAKIAADTTTSAIRQPCRQLRTRAARGAMTDGARAAKFRPPTVE